MEDKDGAAKLAEVTTWRTSSLFNAMERVALEYAEQMTTTGAKIDDALFTRLREQFNEAQLVELTAAIALENFRSKFNPALGVESQGFCLMPK
jgi:alkylhydroperoxidase family enzyme